ncbi:hypothetical protein D3C75_1371340 [compost metagenome]
MVLGAVFAGDPYVVHVNQVETVLNDRVFRPGDMCFPEIVLHHTVHILVGWDAGAVLCNDPGYLMLC